MLQKSASFAGIAGPVVTIVMDGYGLPKNDAGGWQGVKAASGPGFSKGGAGLRASLPSGSKRSKPRTPAENSSRTGRRFRRRIAAGSGWK